MIPRLSYKLDIGENANAWVYDNVLPLEYTGVTWEYLRGVVRMQFVIEVLGDLSLSCSGRRRTVEFFMTPRKDFIAP